MKKTKTSTVTYKMDLKQTHLQQRVVLEFGAHGFQALEKGLDDVVDVRDFVLAVSVFLDERGVLERLAEENGDVERSLGALEHVVEPALTRLGRLVQRVRDVGVQNVSHARPRHDHVFPSKDVKWIGWAVSVLLCVARFKP